MRQRPSFAFRALLSGAAVLLLALFSMMPTGQAPVTEARPALQGTPDNSFPVDLTVDNSVKFSDAGQFITYNFTVFNNATTGCITSSTPGSFGFSLVGPLNVNYNQSITVTPGTSRTFAVRFFIPNDTSPGTQDTGTATISCNANTSISDTETIVLNVTVGGNTPTRTATETSTTTPTVTATSENGSPTATPGPVCRDDSEPNNTLESASEIYPDAPITRVLCPRGDEDWYFFGSTAGKVISIDVTAMTAGLDMALGLYNDEGILIAFNDDFPRGTDPAANIRPRIQSFRIPDDGRYFIRARDTGQRGAPDLAYTIVLISESYGPTPTLVPELCTDLFEPDGVPEQARLMVIREVQPDHRLCPTGDADWVRFFAKKGARYALRVDSKQRVGADPVMILVDRDGASILTFSDDTDGSFDPRIEFIPNVDGFYFAQVKNVGDIGNQFISYDLYYDPLSVAGGTPIPTGAPEEPIPTDDPSLPPPDETTDPGLATPTLDPTFPTEEPTPTDDPNAPPTDTPDPFDDPTQEAIFATQTAVCGPSSPYPNLPDICFQNAPIGGLKGQPDFINGPYKAFVDPAIQSVWSRTDQVVATRKADRTWMWGPTGLVGRAEIYTQSPGGIRQVQYFDKARMEISDWSRDRGNQWFVTNGLLAREMIEGRMQIGDTEFSKRPAAKINIAGDADDAQAPTYASFQGLLARTTNRQGEAWGKLLRRDGKIADYEQRPESQLAYYVPETGHHVAKVFWDFLQSRGPVGDGSRQDVLVDWVFAMGYPISEPYWAKVKVGGVERDVLVQAFQRRVLTYTPTNPTEWRVEMGNVGRHYYQWRYGRMP